MSGELEDNDLELVKKVLQIKADIEKSQYDHYQNNLSRTESEVKRTLDAWEEKKIFRTSRTYGVALVMAIELEKLRAEIKKYFLNYIIEECEELREHAPNVQKMHIKKTQRGFDLIEFVDHYGAACSLQKSSLATEDCIWLGTNTNRMHLTQEQVSQLLPELQSFVETGELGGAPLDEDPDFFEDEKRKFEEGIE